MNKEWKKVRVIVELPTLGDINQKDLAWSVQRAIERDELFYQRMELKGRFGRLRVKQYSNVQGYETRVLKQKVTER